MRKNSVTAKNLQKNIKKYRKIAELTQEELADKIGMSRAYVGYLEQGRNVPSLETLEKISKALNIPMSKLLD